MMTLSISFRILVLAEMRLVMFLLPITTSGRFATNWMSLPKRRQRDGKKTMADLFSPLTTTTGLQNHDLEDTTGVLIDADTSTSISGNDLMPSSSVSSFIELNSEWTSDLTSLDSSTENLYKSSDAIDDKSLNSKFLSRNEDLVNDDKVHEDGVNLIQTEFKYNTKSNSTLASMKSEVKVSSDTHGTIDRLENPERAKHKTKRQLILNREMEPTDLVYDKSKMI